MGSCQMKLGAAGSDFCSKYTSYTKCMDGLLAGCPAQVKTQFSTIMKSATAQYSSQLGACSSSGSGSQNKSPSVSESNSGKDEAKSCSSSELSKKSASCTQKMTSAAAGGDACGVWQTLECCLTEAYSSCGKEGQISTMMSTMKMQYNAILPGLAKCASATCSSASGAPAKPAEVETTLMASIQLSDPLKFDLDKYVEAVQKATGVEQLPVAVVKAFEIIVKYMLPESTDIAKATAAIAKANAVGEEQVQVVESGSRRLGAGRRLAANVDVTITVADKETAAAVQTSAAETATLGSELGGEVKVAKAPVTTAKVETKVKSAPSAASQLVSQIEGKSVGSAVGGTVKAEVKAAPAQTSGASSNFSIVLAAVAILLRAAL